MPEFFLELFSEEIPARMQKEAGLNLAKLTAEALAPLKPKFPKEFYGPRRLAVTTELEGQVPASQFSERGPRVSAPEQALAGFLRKHEATRDQIVQEGEFWVLYKAKPALSARDVILDALPKALSRFPWPKSMRCGQGGDFTWVRPLRRMICLLDGEVVPATLGPITAGSETEGHRIHGPGPVAVFSAAIWEEKLREHYVIVEQDERRRKIADGIAEKAAALGLTVAPDEALLDEVTGLVEFPVPLIGKIDQQFMDLPPEVRELSMKVNQKYFALRDADGNPAPYFAFVANLVADDDGAAIIAGNERVLRARLSDARYFWDTDLKTPLESLLPKLEKITFHAKLGTQRERVDRISDLAQRIAYQLTEDFNEATVAKLAGLYCKVDLVSGMVGEFPELQGIIGGYYSEQSGGRGLLVGPAIKTHYQPKGPGDSVPIGALAISVALADKLDTLVQFFRINEKPTGSSDPYALRRAALGVIRIILENELRLPLKQFLGGDDSLFDFIIERLRIKLRGEGKRFDVLDAVLSVGADDDLVRIMQRVKSVSEFLDSEDGKNLLTAYRRAANILKIEDAKDGPHGGSFVYSSLSLSAPEELPVLDALKEIQSFQGENFANVMAYFARLRGPVDAFFERVTVNDPDPQIRLNRLRLLAQLRDTMHQIADFSKIEG
jgi:glycyl-tRNA synthetase beta chain